MAGTIEKGIVSSVDGYTARVVQSSEGSLVSPTLVIPWHLRDNGAIEKNVEVIYVTFTDQTGMILNRADGELEDLWLPSKEGEEKVNHVEHTHPREGEGDDTDKPNKVVIS